MCLTEGSLSMVNNYAPPSLEAAEQALSFISPDAPREDWIRPLMAIKSAFGDKGRDIAEKWSEQGDSFSQKDFNATWKSINSHGGITISTLFNEAIQNGYQPEKPEPIEPKEAERLKAERLARQQEEERKQTLAQEEAAKKCLEIWNNSSEVTAHSYLDKKQVGAHGLKQSRGNLVVPVRINKILSSLQFIYPDGTKRFKANSVTAGGYHVIGKPKDIILIGEGYGTLASAFEATRYCCVVAFNADNLIPVAKSIRHKFPDKKIVMLADDDWWSKSKNRENSPEENAGIIRATEAAQANSAYLAIPTFKDKFTKPSDFNDLHCLEGLNTVKEQIETALSGKAESTSSTKKYNPPKGYTCTLNGVQRMVEDGDPEWITFKPVEVTALSRDESGNNWGVLVWWVDLDGKEHEIAIPKKLFHAQGTELAQLLADGGLQIVPGREKALLRYLAAFNVEYKLMAASSTGWLKESFVLPTESINEPEGQRIVYQPTGLSNISKSIHRKGSFDTWKEGMASASPMIIFFVCAGLSAPVRFKTGIEAGGYHAYNLTSQGKTTMLQAVSSVFGNGVDPAIAGGDEAYIQRWNGTANALEAKAVAFNDLPMTIDEIGEGDAREFGQTIYRIISGTGRSRAGRSGELRDSKSWRVTIVSAGELAVSDFIESGGGSIKGGQMVRLVDIDLSVNEKLFKNAGEANSMKKLCANHYGHAGVEMLKAIPDLTYGWKDFDQSIIGEAATSIASRVRTRFALVAYTGVIAAKAGILPWRKEQIIESVKSAYLSWHDNISVVSDIDRGVEAVKDFILKHESRFETNSEHPPANRAGWYRDGMYHFSPAAFKEACSGSDPTKVKKALRDLGLLHTNKRKGFQSTVKVSKKSINVISVKSEILSNSLKQGSAGSVGSAELDISTVKSGTTSECKVVSGSAGNGDELNSGTTDTTSERKVVSAESPVNKGWTPPTPPTPPKVDNFSEDF